MCLRFELTQIPVGKLFTACWNFSCYKFYIMYLQATCICECLEMRLQWAKEQVKYTYRAALSTKWCFLQFYELSSLLSHKQESFQILEKGIKIMRFRQCYWIDLALYIWIYYKVFEFWTDQIVWSALAHTSSVILLIVYRHWIYHG